MVLNIITAIGAGIVLLFVVATVIRQFGGRGLATLIAQSAVNTTAGYILLSIGFVQLPIAAALALMPLALRIVAYLWFYWQNKKVLRGDFGEKPRWAAELVGDGDDEFIEASMRLPDIEMKEIGIVSDSKEELREKTIERVNELEQKS